MAAVPPSRTPEQSPAAVASGDVPVASRPVPHARRVPRLAAQILACQVAAARRSRQIIIKSCELGLGCSRDSVCRVNRPAYHRPWSTGRGAVQTPGAGPPRKPRLQRLAQLASVGVGGRDEAVRHLRTG